MLLFLKSISKEKGMTSFEIIPNLSNFVYKKNNLLPAPGFSHTGACLKQASGDGFFHLFITLPVKYLFQASKWVKLIGEHHLADIDRKAADQSHAELVFPNRNDICPAVDVPKDKLWHFVAVV